MKKFRTMAAVAILAVSLLATMVTPASAATATVGAFVGRAEVVPGISSPVGTACGVGLCPADSGSWSFWVQETNGIPLGVGAGVSSDAPVAGLLTEPDVDSRIAGALGSVDVESLSFGAWCGISSGEAGSGPLEISGGVGSASVTTTDVGWTTSAGSLIVFDGTTTAGGTVVGLVSAVPPNPATDAALGIAGGSCLGGTATLFTVVGAAAVVIP